MTETVVPVDMPDEPHRGLHRRGMQAAVAVGAVVLVAVPVAASMFADSATVSEQTRSDVVSAATDGVVSVLSYRANSVAADVDSAKTFLTGDFLTYYSGFAEQSVVPGATERGITSSATVSGSSIVSVEQDDAVALLFVNQNVTSTDSPDPRASSTSLRVEMTLVDGRWLISALDPI